MDEIAELRATPENPSFDLNSPEALDALEAGAPSASGIRVNSKSALTYSPWWRGINLISQSLSKLPLFVYKRNGEGKDRFPQHPAYSLLRYQPNEYQTALIFQQQLQGHALSKGNGYAYIEMDGDGNPLALLPMDPDTVTVVRVNGVVWYVIRTGVYESKLDTSQVLHIRGLGWDGLVGYNVLELARDTIGLGIGQTRYTAKTLSQGGRPGMILETPNTIPPADRQYLRDTWEKMHSGIDNAHRTAILDRGLKANAISFSNDDQQLIEQRKFQIIDVANFLGIPPHKLGGGERTSYASLEQENTAFLDDCLDFWLCNWEYECRSKLLTEKEKQSDTVVAEFMRNALMRADSTARGNYYRAALGGHPWATVDEVRGMENLNPLGGIAAELQPPANMGGQNNQPEDPAASNVKPKRDAMIGTVRKAVEDAAKRAAKRIGVHAIKAATTPRKFIASVEELIEANADAMTDIMEPALDLRHQLGGPEAVESIAEMRSMMKAQLIEAANVPAKRLAEVVQKWADDAPEYWANKLGEWDK